MQLSTALRSRKGSYLVWMSLGIDRWTIELPLTNNYLEAVGSNRIVSKWANFFPTGEATVCESGIWGVVNCTVVVVVVVVVVCWRWHRSPRCRNERRSSKWVLPKWSQKVEANQRTNQPTFTSCEEEKSINSEAKKWSLETDWRLVWVHYGKHQLQTHYYHLST